MKSSAIRFSALVALPALFAVFSAGFRFTLKMRDAMTGG